MAQIGYYLITDKAPTITLSLEADLVSAIDGVGLDGMRSASTLTDIDLVVYQSPDSLQITVPRFQIRDINHADRGGILIDQVVGQCNIDAPASEEFAYSITIY